MSCHFASICAAPNEQHYSQNHVSMIKIKQTETALTLKSLSLYIVYTQSHIDSVIGLKLADSEGALTIVAHNDLIR